MGESDFRDGHLKLECAKRSTKRRKVSREKLWRASRDPRSKSTHRFPGQKCNRRRKLDGHANDIAPPVNFTGTSEICSCQENVASLHHCYNIRIISHLTAPSIWNLISTSGTSSSSSHSFSSPRERRQGPPRPRLGDRRQEGSPIKTRCFAPGDNLRKPFHVFNFNS